MGDFFQVRLGSDVRVIVQDPNDIEIVLNNARYIDKAADYYVFKPWMRDGMLLSTGQKQWNIIFCFNLDFGDIFLVFFFNLIRQKIP